MSAKRVSENDDMRDAVSFQEIPDPFVETLQKAIDALRAKSDAREFGEVLDKIYQKFPLVDLLEFVDLYVEGEYTKGNCSRSA